MKYQVNHDFFSEIDTEEKAYWLGFLYGDGYIDIKPKKIYRVCLTLQNKDKKHLEKFRESLNSNHNIYDKFTKNKLIGVRIRIYSKKLVNDLIKWGCIPNKSLELSSIPNISDYLIRDFIRGEFDADGSLFLHTTKYGKYPYISLCGNHPFISNIQKYLVNNNIIDHCNKIEINGNRSYMKYEGSYAINFLDYIYKNSKIYLERKYKRYLNYKQL